MKILGIETSCDETGAAVVENGKHILSNVVVSSLKEHTRYGGVLPEIASRRQLECLRSVVTEALERAGTSLKDIERIAVTETPGLIGSLLVGISFAKMLSRAAKIPYGAIDHVKAHAYANFISADADFTQPKLPAVGLVVSGGHTNLYLIRSFTDFVLLGKTRDDAVGEAFDKVARICGLAYPGGPEIDRLSKQAKKSELQFTCAPLPDTLDFSFSGIKTAVLYHVRKEKLPSAQSVKQIAFAFQESVVKTLVAKCLMAARREKVRTILVGGGVAANSRLREHLTEEAAKAGLSVHVPPIALCLDNAAMIAGLAFHQRS
jgi:N6-L-threonylcarbamoyladenine synthase